MSPLSQICLYEKRDVINFILFSMKNSNSIPQTSSQDEMKISRSVGAMEADELQKERKQHKKKPIYELK